MFVSMVSRDCLACEYVEKVEEFEICSISVRNEEARVHQMSNQIFRHQIELI